MTHAARRLVTAALLACLGLVFWLPAASAAQTAQVPVAGQAAPPGPQAGPAPVFTGEDFTAERTREELYQLLDKYPPALGRVLKLDPSLMTSEPYLAPYPALAAFLARHPEVARNSAYFLERVSIGEQNWVPDRESMRRREIAEMLAGVGAFIIVLVVTAFVTWVVRTIIEHRRWNKVSKTQFDVHTKLLDRFTTNEELLAYIQTPVGRRFLESGPAPLPGEPRPVGAPFSRILWSVQAGVVLAVAGIGLIVSSRYADEFSLLFVVSGIFVLALGGGFAASGAVAYGLSRRLGLMERFDADQS